VPEGEGRFLLLGLTVRKTDQKESSPGRLRSAGVYKEKEMSGQLWSFRLPEK
jgi:hypothetical protein